MLLDDGFVEVSRIKAYAEGSFRFFGGMSGGHPFHWLGGRGDNFLVNHFLKEFFNSLSTFNGDLSSSMLNWEDRGV